MFGVIFHAISNFVFSPVTLKQYTNSHPCASSTTSPVSINISFFANDAMLWRFLQGKGRDKVYVVGRVNMNTSLNVKNWSSSRQQSIFIFLHPVGLDSLWSLAGNTNCFLNNRESIRYPKRCWSPLFSFSLFAGDAICHSQFYWHSFKFLILRTIVCLVSICCSCMLKTTKKWGCFVKRET